MDMAPTAYPITEYIYFIIFAITSCKFNCLRYMSIEKQVPVDNPALCYMTCSGSLWTYVSTNPYRTPDLAIDGRNKISFTWFIDQTL